MTRPDLLLYATLVHQGVMSYEQASAIVESYNAPHDYDNPAPIDLEAALFMACEAIHAGREDEMIAEMLGGGDGESDPSHTSDMDLPRSPPSWWIDAYADWAILRNDE